VKRIILAGAVGVVALPDWLDRWKFLSPIA
jgi:hypothetical protein